MKEGFHPGEDPRPPEVTEAIKRGDKEAIKRMAKAGGEANANRLALKKALETSEARHEAIDHEYREILANEGEEAAQEYLKEIGLI